MDSVIEWFKGKKTYFVAAGVGIVVALNAAGLIDAQMTEVLLGGLGAAGAATLAAKINRTAA